MPKNVHVYLATRSEPQFHIAHLRATGMINRASNFSPTLVKLFQMYTDPARQAPWAIIHLWHRTNFIFILFNHIALPSDHGCGVPAQSLVDRAAGETGL
jgi:hypothetical protein